ncbi:metaphase-anaphase transition protein (Mlo2) [Purpureocillium lavendulum]|uniref:Metaphase-anaphase transition protein (Mlo2) n=1 Tax=Purpureocillium lavendulum TaxID=1247861 RepID=A0AB34FY60_9HYPO|nr:metaphase-anaphase transition protein (Mlo2) [Purpureocillium lavendulum]
MTQRHIQQSRQHKGHLEANVASRLGNGPRPPHLVHARHDEAEAGDAGRDGGGAPGQARGVAPDGGVVREVPGHAAAEGDVLGADNGDKGGGPVPDEGDKVLEVDEEVVDGGDGDGDDDGGDEDAEDVPRHAGEPGHERLEVERDGVKGAARVAEQRQRQHDDDKLAEAAGARQHARERAADEVLVVPPLPVGIVGDGARDGGAERHEQHRGDQQAPVGVVEDAPAGDAGVKVRRQVAGDGGPGDLVAGDDHAKVEDLAGRGRGLGLGLAGEAGAADAGGDGDGDEGDGKGVRLEDVQDLEAGKGDEQRQQGDDDDAGVGGDAALGDGGEALAADDADDDGEAGEGREVEEDGDGDDVAAVGGGQTVSGQDDRIRTQHKLQRHTRHHTALARGEREREREREGGRGRESASKYAPKAVPRLDHLAHARLGPQDGQGGGGQRRQQAEEEDDEGRVAQAQAVDGGPEHAKGDAEDVGVDGEPDGEDVEEARVGALVERQRADAVFLDATHAQHLVQQRLGRRGRGRRGRRGRVKRRQLLLLLPVVGVVMTAIVVMVVVAAEALLGGGGGVVGRRRAVLGVEGHGRRRRCPVMLLSSADVANGPWTWPVAVEDEPATRSEARRGEATATATTMAAAVAE